MSKKTKRQTQKTTTIIPSVPAAYSSSNGSSTVRSARSTDREFNPDYSYVVKDLRRIATLAGSFFVILVVLSFFLR